MGTYEDTMNWHKQKRQQEEALKVFPREDKRGMPTYSPEKPFKDKIGKRFIFECPHCMKTNIVIAEKSSGFQICACQQCGIKVRVRV